MSDGKIYIVVTDKLPSGGNNPFPDKDDKKEDKKDSVFEKYLYHRMFNFVEGQVKQALNYTLSNIGNFTGDYQAQRNVNAMLSLGSKLMNIGNAAIVGAKVGNLPGAVIAATLATASEAITYAYQQHSLLIQQNKTNLAIERLQQRSGLNALIDGSRGTEN